MTPRRVVAPSTTPARPLIDGPYDQSYGYDAFDHLTSRSWRYFATNAYGVTAPTGSSAGATYVNNQQQGWLYDGEGNVTRAGTDTSWQYTYDASGQQATASEPGRSSASSYDGDGQRVKQTLNGTVTYYVRSSVLGGQVVTELNSAGQKKATNVYANGHLIAKQESTRVLWEQFDPSGVSGVWIDQQGTQTDRIELDALGSQTGQSGYIFYSWEEAAQTGTSNYYQYQQQAYYSLMAGISTSANDAYRGCSLDGGSVPCDFVRQLMNAGATAAQYWIHDNRGWHPEQSPIVPLGLGLFAVDTPRVGRDEEGDYLDWRSMIFSFVDPQKTAGQRCDERLAGIFGGDGTVFATDHDPSTLQSGAGRDRLSSPSEDPRRGIAHIYASETGAGVAAGNLFTPSGYLKNKEERAPYIAHAESIPELQNYHRFTYLPGSLQRYGYSGGLVISFIHTGPTDSRGRPLPANPSIKNDAGSILVGTIGAFGGKVNVGGSDPGYVHTHIRFYKADRRGRRGAGTDPRTVFCSDLGF